MLAVLLILKLDRMYKLNALLTPFQHFKRRSLFATPYVLLKFIAS